jgi:dipeptidyl aminopeptidase/acylaminoacyl peptidase
MVLGKVSRNAFVVLVTCFPVTGSIHTVSLAEEVAPMPVDDALQMQSFPEFSPVAFSPDGRWLAYTVRRHSLAVDDEEHMGSSIPSVRGGGDIYVTEVATRHTRRLTDGQSYSWMPAWSPDGRLLAFLSDAQGGHQQRVWIWDAAAGELKRPSDVNVVMGPGDRLEWLPDGRTVLFLEQPKEMSFDDLAQRIPSEAKANSVPRNTLPAAGVVLYQGNSKRESGGRGARSDPWNLDLFVRDLVALDIPTRKAVVLVHGRKIRRFEIAPDGSRVAFVIPQGFEKAGSQQILFDLMVLDVSSRRQQVAASGLRLNLDGTGFSWSPSGLQLAFHAGGMEERSYDCYVVDIRDGHARNVTNFAPGARMRGRPSTPLWKRSGEAFYFLREGNMWQASVKGSKASELASIPGLRITGLVAHANNLLWMKNEEATIVLTHDDAEKRDGFYEVNLDTGSSRKLVEDRECYTAVFGLDNYLVPSPTGDRLAYFAEDAREAPELWTSDTGFHTREPLTNVNARLKRVALGESRLVDWLSDDGGRLSGALLLPSNYEEGQRYPLVVWVYGGSTLSDRLNRFGLGYTGPFNMQLLATRGYAVFLPDAPQHLRTPMLDLAKAVLPGVNKVVELGIADPAHLGVIGHSYGGYSALALIVQTKRFKAAIAVDGYGDLGSAYGQMLKDGTAFQTSIMERGQGLMGGTPWERRAEYIENSPFYYLDQVETPVLLIHGSLDANVVPSLSDQLFVGLRRLGKEVEYARYENEGHAPTAWRYENQRDYCERVLAWFGRFLHSAGP